VRLIEATAEYRVYTTPWGATRKDYYDSSGALGYLDYAVKDRASWAQAKERMHPTRSQFDEEQNIQPLQPKRIHCEEIAGQDLLLIMCHEMPPTLGPTACCRRLNGVTFEYIPYGRLGHRIVQFK
jgi:hypothetical protein